MAYEVERELIIRARELCRDSKPKVPIAEAAQLNIAIKIFNEVISSLSRHSE